MRKGELRMRGGATAYPLYTPGVNLTPREIPTLMGQLVPQWIVFEKFNVTLFLDEVFHRCTISFSSIQPIDEESNLCLPPRNLSATS